MFDHLLEESIVEGEAIVEVVTYSGSETPADPALAAGVMVARELFADPENIQRLVTRMDTIRSNAWW